MADKVFRRAGSPFRGGDPIWMRQNPAGVIADNEFFGITSIDTSGYLKYWTGLDWVLKPVKFWDGVWSQKPVRYWDGFFWLKTNYGYGTNFHPNSLDLFDWTGATGNSCTLSRELVEGSPSGGVTLKMTVTGNDPHTSTYNSSAWNLSLASNQETWIVKVWVKSNTGTTGELFIFGADSGGNFINNPAAYNSKPIYITGNWTEETFSITFPKQSSLPNLAYVQARLDGPNTGGTGQVIFWDDLRVYKLV